MERSPTKSTPDSQEEKVVDNPKQSDWVAAALGMLTFVLGLGLLIFTFRHAAQMFSVSAREALGDEKDVTELGKSFGHVLLRIGLLLVMSVVGSLIAGQGIRLYFAARSKS